MAKYKDILGNERAVADETVTISLERYNQLIIKEAVAEISCKCDNAKNIVRFYIKGTCVFDLFSILESNGYPVQMSTIQDDTDTYRVDVMMKKESEDK